MRVDKKHSCEYDDYPPPPRVRPNCAARDELVVSNRKRIDQPIFPPVICQTTSLFELLISTPGALPRFSLFFSFHIISQCHAFHDGKPVFNSRPLRLHLPRFTPRGPFKLGLQHSFHHQDVNSYLVPGSHSPTRARRSTPIAQNLRF